MFRQTPLSSTAPPPPWSLLCPTRTKTIIHRSSNSSSSKKSMYVSVEKERENDFCFILVGQCEPLIDAAADGYLVWVNNNACLLQKCQVVYLVSSWRCCCRCCAILYHFRKITHSLYASLCSMVYPQTFCDKRVWYFCSAKIHPYLSISGGRSLVWRKLCVTNY